MSKLQVPFFRPTLEDSEINEVIATLRSGWLTSGPKVKRFEDDFAAIVGSTMNGHIRPQSVHAVAVNSGTAALHLAVEALGLRAGQYVLVPTMTFAATAEVVRYMGAIPVLVDCDPLTLNIDLDQANRKAEELTRGSTKGNRDRALVGIMPVHVGGQLVNLEQLQTVARRHGMWIVEDAAHAFPAAWRQSALGQWLQRSNGAKSVTCYSFYANKTITTGEGGMAVTSNPRLAERMRMMSLHGLSADAWRRYSANAKWDYKIVAPGYKYNLTDIGAAIGIHQLARAEAMRKEREAISQHYLDKLASVSQIELPATDSNRLNSHHLFVIKLHLKRLRVNRDQFMDEVRRAGVGCSVHWRPLHLHPYYQRTFGVRAKDFPVATAQWKRIISLPIFPGMHDDEIEHVVRTIRKICKNNAR